MHGDANEYRILNDAVASILSYTTAGITTQGGAIHTQIVGNQPQNTATNWDVVSVQTQNGSFK
jgi:hypothetical protein